MDKQTNNRHRNNHGSMKKGASHKNRMTKSVIRLILLVCAVVCIAIIGNVVQKRLFTPQEVRGDLSVINQHALTMDYEGEKYIYKNRLTNILIMGIDRYSEQQSSAGFRSGGQADYMGVAVLDSENKTVQWIPIDRDTMTDITVLGVLGNQAGVKNAQICLSHGFGDGGQMSSELTVQAVQSLFYGIPIDYFAAFDLDGIETINDLVGGITVTLADDFSQLDAQMTSGATLTLHGKQAEYYVRSRINIGDGTNQARMKRQTEYLQLLENKITECLDEDINFIDELLSGMDSYMVTNMKRAQMISLVHKAKQFTHQPDVEIAGTHTVGADGFMEFHADTESLKELAWSVFFEKASY